MRKQETASGARAVTRRPANDRFKARFAGWVWGSIGIASGVHAAIFAFGPALGTVPVSEGVTREMRFVELPPAVTRPEPPPPIPRPALPVVAELDIDVDVPIEPVTFERYEPPPIPSPPAAARTEGLLGYEHIAPTMVAPVLKNRGQVERALKAAYPRNLQAAGIGGELLVWFWIDEDGRIVQSEIKRASGVNALDRAAEDVIGIMEFSPALHNGSPVRVIVALPIRFVSE